MLLLRLGIRAISLRTLLVVMIAFASVPILVFGGIVLARYADSERHKAEVQLQESTRGIARAIDSHFLAITGVTSALASSPLIGEGEFGEFGYRLQAATEKTGIQFQLFNSDGTALTDTIARGSIRRAWADSGLSPLPEGETAYVTNILGTQADQSLHARVIVPISHGNGNWALHGIAMPQHFLSILDNPGVPRDWIVSIVDRNAVHLVRSHAMEKYAGLPLVQPLSEHVRAQRRDILRTVTLEGIAALSAVAYAPNTQWVAAVGLPQDILDAPLRNQLVNLLFLGGVLIGLALFLGLLLARYLDRTMQGLGELARKVGSGETVEPEPTAIREVVQLGDVLKKASLELKIRAERLALLNSGLEREVDSRTEELAEANRKLVDEMKRREESETQLRHMQKIEAIGQLTGGIAHDFNNMLAVVMNSLHLIQRRLARGQTGITDLIDGALHGTERAVTLTQRLLAFSRQQPLAPAAIDANRLLSGMDSLLRRTLPENIEIEMVLHGGLWQARADIQALESAIINLAANARDAMPEGGKLTLETGNVDLGDSYSATHDQVAPGQYVMIALTDTGTGMTPDVVEKVFDPFFTTKPVGAGTGLGLSQVHGFMRQSGGLVNIYSEPGIGTTVKLYLPRFQGEGAVAIPQAEEDHPTLEGHGEVVLIVEDDDDMRELVVQMVEELDYVPIEANAPQDALNILDEHPEIRLLMTDVIMPQMNGRVLADEALRRRPDLKVLFTTGYTRNAIIHNGVLDAGVHLINKPFKIDVLARKLAELLKED